MTVTSPPLSTTSLKLGVQFQFLGVGYYYPSTEKIRQVYPVWCSRIHNHTLFTKKLCKKHRVHSGWTHGYHIAGCWLVTVVWWQGSLEARRVSQSLEGIADSSSSQYNTWQWTNGLISFDCEPPADRQTDMPSWPIRQLCSVKWPVAVTQADNSCHSCPCLWKAVVDVPCNLQHVVIIIQSVVDINQ